MQRPPDIEERLRGDFPVEDPAARERARRRLRTAMDEERSQVERRHRGRWAVAGAAAAIVALLVTLQVLLPPGSGGPRLGAAAELRHLGALSTAGSTLQLGPSEFLYHETKQEHGERTISVVDGSEYTLDVVATVDTWVAADGSGQSTTTYDKVSFAADADRVVWEQHGEKPLPVTGSSVTYTYGPAELPYFAVDQLPSDPKELKSTLEAGTVIKVAEGDANLLSRIGTLLAQGDVTPDVRKSLFVVASQIPGVSVVYDTVDPIGRPAVAVSVSDSYQLTTLFFDPDDASLLAQSESPERIDASASAPSWIAYTSSAVVARAGAVPGGSSAN